MATIHDAFAAAAIISLFFLLVEARLARELDDWDHFDAVSERLSDAVLTEVERRAAGVNIAGEGREGPAETGGRGPWFYWIPGGGGSRPLAHRPSGCLPRLAQGQGRTPRSTVPPPPSSWYLDIFVAVPSNL